MELGRVLIILPIFRSKKLTKMSGNSAACKSGNFLMVIRPGIDILNISLHVNLKSWSWDLGKVLGCDFPFYVIILFGMLRKKTENSLLRENTIRWM